MTSQSGLSLGLPVGGRAGRAHGDYPERAEREEWALERWLETRIDAARRRRAFSLAHLNRIVVQIEDAGETLARLPDDVLAMSTAGLRMRLSVNPADEALLVQAFALTRESAARRLGLRHFPSQLMGGWVIYHGMLARMQTGEGKTLTACLPAATAALCGVPVHVITANDYLAARDAESMRPVYEALGVSVGVVTDAMDPDDRLAAYQSDVTYCTNSQVAFDYLRDGVSRGGVWDSTHLKLQRLYEHDVGQTQAEPLCLRGLCFAIVDEADSVLVDEARTPLILSRSGGDEIEEALYRKAMELAGELVPKRDFRLDTKDRHATLTARGSELLAQRAVELDSIWSATRRREELVCQALCAHHLYLRDLHYVVREERVEIVDQGTGRLMPDRSWQGGLHQMVEIKESCAVTAGKETMARISYQRFFSRYLKLGGMTGTTKNIETELETVYRLPIVPIPTHRPSRRIAWPTRTYFRAEDKIQAIIASVHEVHRTGRPILVGTRSVQDSEALGRRLAEQGLTPTVLNAREAEDEADIVAKAGKKGQILVATNMAGRGTDIHLHEGVPECGGLHVIVAERNEAARVDRQLIGRCARQGDPGSYQIYQSFEDVVPREFLPRWLVHLTRTLVLGRKRAPRGIGSLLVTLAQLSLERRHRKARQLVAQQDKRLADVLAFSGRGE